jgi:hypothetical protein
MAHQTQADQRAGKVEQVAEQLGATLVTDRKPPEVEQAK